MTPLLLRADATARMGTGHLMRCLALAQTWQDAGGPAVVAAAELPAASRARLAAEGCEVVPVLAAPGSPADAAETAALAARAGADWVAVDGYQFAGDYQQRVKATGRRVLAIDDYGHAGHYPADLVLNQNLGADAGWYARRGPDTRLLLGPRYAVLRREFARYRGWRREVPDVARKVLVTLGGADPENVTLRVVRALGRVDVDGLEAVVVVGGANPHRAGLEEAARGCPARVEVRADVGNMSELMAWADVAVAAGGTTTWERALLGLPSLILVLADNQAGVAAAAGGSGLGWDLGRPGLDCEESVAARLAGLMRAPGDRDRMARRGQETVDGRGGERVARAMAGGPAVRLRPATPADARVVWEWANDPVTRAASCSAAAIPWADHVGWFAGKLADPGCVFLIVEAPPGQPVGQLRFDIAGPEAVVSVGLAPAARGRGYGAAAVRAGCDALFAGLPVARVVALIRDGNQASVRAFTAAGFTPAGRTAVKDPPALRYVRAR